jgi:hypothetical protein
MPFFQALKNTLKTFLLSTPILLSATNYNAAIGGTTPHQKAYAASVSVQSPPSASSILSTTVNGSIKSIAIDQYGTIFIGGSKNNQAYAAVLASGRVFEITLSDVGEVSVINSVAIYSNSNVATYVIFGGSETIQTVETAYASGCLILFNDFESLSANKIPLTIESPSKINSVAISNSHFILAGHQTLNGAQAAYAAAAKISNYQTTGLNTISFSPATPTEIKSVAINSDKLIILGGDKTTNPSAAYAGVVDADSYNMTAQDISPDMNVATSITSVGINNDNQIILGGYRSYSSPPQQPTAYAGRYVGSTLYPIKLPSNPSQAPQEIQSVDINDSGQIILGGKGFHGAAYAATYDPVQLTTNQITLPNTPFPSEINSVAINDSGQIILGGFTQNSFAMTRSGYAATVTLPVGSSEMPRATEITLTNTSEILSVAINNVSKTSGNGTSTNGSGGTGGATTKNTSTGNGRGTN